MIEELKSMLRGIEEAIYYEEVSQNGNYRLIANLDRRAKALRKAIKTMESCDKSMKKMNERRAW